MNNDKETHISLKQIQRKAESNDNSIQDNIKLSPDSWHPVFGEFPSTWQKLTVVTSFAKGHFQLWLRNNFCCKTLRLNSRWKSFIWLHNNKTQAIYPSARESKWMGAKIGFLSIGRGLRHFEDESTHVWRNHGVCIRIKTRCKQWATKAVFLWQKWKSFIWLHNENLGH